MAIDVFTWPLQLQSGSQGEHVQRVKTVQYGDGYKQVSGDGINPETQKWPVTFLAKHQEAMAVLNFMRAHCTRSFTWTTPMGETKIFIVVADSIRSQRISLKHSQVTATFEQTYS